MPHALGTTCHYGDISTRRHGEFTAAWLKGKPCLYQHGLTEAEAIGYLVFKLAAKGYTLTLQSPTTHDA